MMTRRLHRQALYAALLLLACPAACLAAKTDVLVLKNGDTITGEIKGLSRGKLDYSTDDAGRLGIEWVKVARLTSIHSFEVEVASGAKYFGQLVSTGRDGTLVVQGAALEGAAAEGATVDTLSIPTVVGIDKIGAGFLRRVKAFLDLGLTIAKANKATTLSSAGEAAYRGTDYGGAISFDSYTQGQESTPTTSRNSVGLQAIRFLPKRWSVTALGKTEQNDELNLELRLTGAGVLGRTLTQSNSSEMGAGVGLAVSRERFAPSGAATSADGNTTSSLEALVTAKWDAFRFDSPSLDFSTSLFLFPSLSESGRVRGEFTLRLKYELFSDFDVGVSGTDTFDSNPPEEGVTKNDFVTSFTIGWSYRR